MVINPRKIRQNLLKKGFIEVQKTKHIYYKFEPDGIKTDIQTFMSRNNQEIGNELISEMKDQLYLNKKEFIDLIDCKLSEEDYIKILKTKDLLAEFQVNKPEYLYHGSQYLLETLMPKQAKDNSEIGSQFALYACEDFDSVIPFALPIRWYPDNPTGKKSFSCRKDKILIEYGSINPNGVGYIYKISSEYFEKIDGWQWVSIKEITPIEVIQIKVEDYWLNISFSKEALEINKLLYPSDTLYLDLPSFPID
ncbi:MAG: hypothetical protein FWD71_07250 [Oscillospiraceae bacterium]|nr:hypothetical protein [Oscillospiraceae bacterium]